MEVIFIPAEKICDSKITDLCRRLCGFITPDQIIAIKLHFGEPGNTTFLKPKYVRPVVDFLRNAKAKPFLTDTNTLYVGRRSNSVDHLNAAIEHGFGGLGAPIIIADGLRSRNVENVRIRGKHFKSVGIAADIVHCDSLVVLTHFKGHMLMGFGGALKNIGMGCAGRAGKQAQHSTIKPVVSSSGCIKCKVCGRYCPANAISYPEGIASIDPKKCVGCGECAVMCRAGAISVRFDSSASDAQERMAEYALGVMQSVRNRLFINFLVDITPNCDCFNKSEAVLTPDIGIVAGTDPVAVDKACYDLVCKKAGRDVFKEFHNIDSTIQIRYGSGLGLGSPDYNMTGI
ncbi:MAG: DUF362 domain-containing protein [archaeon]